MKKLWQRISEQKEKKRGKVKCRFEKKYEDFFFEKLNILDAFVGRKVSFCQNWPLSDLTILKSIWRKDVKNDRKQIEVNWWKAKKLKMKEIVVWYLLHKSRQCFQCFFPYKPKTFLEDHKIRYKHQESWHLRT